MTRGVPLSPRCRRHMEAVFGESFECVRVHVDSQAAVMLGAQAFTVGEHIHLAPGAGPLDSLAGSWLLAHELAHVVQQRQGRVSSPPDRDGVVFDMELEREADAIATLAVLARGRERLERRRPRRAAPCLRASPAVIQCKVVDKNNQAFDTKAVVDYIEKHLPALARKFLDSDTLELIDEKVKSNDTTTLADLVKSIVTGNDRLEKRIIARQRQFRGKRAIEGAITIDRRKGGITSELRRKELESIIGNVQLARLFGFRTAKHLTEAKNQLSLRIAHDLGTSYMREGVASEAAAERESELLKKHKITDANAKLVNSAFVRRKLEVLRGKSYTSTMWFKQLAPCVWVCFRKKKHGLDHLNRTSFSELGAHASVYQVDRALHGDKEPGEGKQDNGQLLSQIIASEPFEELEAIAAGKRSKAALCRVYAAAVHLIRGLSGVRTLAPKKFDASLAVDTALKSIAHIIRALGSSAGDSLTTGRLYELLTDELFVVLGAVQPYDDKSFTQAILSLYTKRIPSTTLPFQAVCLESSGMGALSTALAAALCDHQQPAVGHVHADSDYFELPKLLDLCVKNGGTDRRAGNADKANIIYATLNPSTPAYKPESDMVKAIADSVDDRITNKKVTPLTLVIDVTIEVDAGKNSQLDKLFVRLDKHIQKHDLNVILAKSYQKFSALGSGKIAAGLVMVINKGDDRFAASTQFVNDAMVAHEFAQLVEIQLMIFYLNAAAEDEIALLQQAAKNATFVHDNVWKPRRVSGQYGNYAAGLPFLLSADSCVTHAADQLVQPFGVDYRNSFGYVVTSYLVIDKRLRIAVGQEAEHELVEKLYAIGRIDTEVDAKSALTAVRKHLTGLLETHKPGNDNYQANQHASLLHLAASMPPRYEKDEKGEEQIDEPTRALRAKLSSKLPSMMAYLDKLSPTMRERIVLHWLADVDYLKFGGLDGTAMGDVRKYTVHVRPAWRAGYFIDHPHDSAFAKLELVVQRALTRLLMAEHDVDTLVYVCSRLASVGALTKLRRVGEMIDERLSVYVLTKARLARVTSHAKVLDIEEQIGKIENLVCSYRGELVGKLTELAKLTTPSEKQRKAIEAIVDVAKTKRETCFYITLADIREIVPKQEKDIEHLDRRYFASANDLADKVENSLGYGSWLASSQLVDRAKRRADGVLRNRGLNDIAGEMHFDSIEAIRKLQGELLELSKPSTTFAELFFAKATQERKIKLKTLIEELKLRANNTGFCLQELGDN